MKTINDTVLTLGEIIDYCNQSADTVHGLYADILEKIGHGESEVSAIGAMAFFMQKENVLRYEIPNIICGLVNEKAEKEGDSHE